ncbi:MAG TPA: hypothetical protein VKU85_07680 [bacterium]|nr:hypothetical protein [bacterium]
MSPRTAVLAATTLVGLALAGAAVAAPPLPELNTFDPGLATEMKRAAREAPAPGDHWENHDALN